MDSNSPCKESPFSHGPNLARKPLYLEGAVLTIRHTFAIVCALFMLSWFRTGLSTPRVYLPAEFFDLVPQESIESERFIPLLPQVITGNSLLFERTFQ